MTSMLVWTRRTLTKREELENQAKIIKNEKSFSQRFEQKKKHQLDIETGILKFNEKPGNVTKLFFYLFNICTVPLFAAPILRLLWLRMRPEIRRGQATNPVYCIQAVAVIVFFFFGDKEHVTKSSPKTTRVLPNRSRKLCSKTTKTTQ
jgi:hypothetical protein